MPNIMDPILPILSILGYWAIALGTLEDHVRKEPRAKVQTPSAKSEARFKSALTRIRTPKVPKMMAVIPKCRVYGSVFWELWRSKKT